MEFSAEDAKEISGNRTRLGWTRMELAVMTGVPEEDIAKIERNDFLMSEDWESHIKSIQKALLQGEKKERRHTDDIRDCKVLTKIVYAGRWFVSLDHAFNKRTIIPQYIYVWLMGNPLFKNIPKGYVVHHLDGDKSNDDISNLALMKDQHHRAHHMKNWKEETEDIETRSGPPLRIKRHDDPPLLFGEDPSEPYVRKFTAKNLKQERWSVNWMETDPITGKRVFRRFIRTRAGPLCTQEDAEKARGLLMKIHPGFREKPEDSLRVKNLIWEIHAATDSDGDLTEQEIRNAYYMINQLFVRLY